MALQRTLRCVEDQVSAGCGRQAHVPGASNHPLVAQALASLLPNVAQSNTGKSSLMTVLHRHCFVKLPAAHYQDGAVFEQMC